MWSDEINKKLVEADGSTNPAYNDKAWESMELLLDKHLPLKKKRRWFIFLLFPLLLAGTTGILIFQKRDKDRNLIIEQKNMPVQSSPSTEKKIDEGNSIALPVKKTTPIVTPQNPILSKTENLSSDKKSQSQFIPPYLAEKNRKYHQRRQTHEQPLFFPEKMPAKKTEHRDNDLVRSNSFTPAPTTELSNAVINKLVNISATPVTTDSLAATKTIGTEEQKKEDTAQTKSAMLTSKQEKGKHSSLNKLSLNLSFGPDISSVGIDKPGKLKMQLGLGFSYHLSKKFSIRTGFFAGYKKYTADSADYHPSYTINNLQKIDANCYVYEIPFTVVYNMAVTKKHNWFISGGLSSYVMKKETYGYHYKNIWGQSQYYKHTYRNESSHLFSVINISGGYQYHLSNRFSIMAEPYVKIPTVGIGVGKVKLNSAGILFTVGLKPFLK